MWLQHGTSASLPSTLLMENSSLPEILLQFVSIERLTVKFQSWARRRRWQKEGQFGPKEPAARWIWTFSLKTSSWRTWCREWQEWWGKWEDTKRLKRFKSWHRASRSWYWVFRRERWHFGGFSLRSRQWWWRRRREKPSFGGSRGRTRKRVPREIIMRHRRFCRVVRKEHWRWSPWGWSRPG